MNRQHVARKRFGQHFLTDESVLDAITHAIRPLSGEHMVEIGPGLTALTRRLAPVVNPMHVIEIDRDLVGRLHAGPLAKHLIIHEADALTFDYASLPGPLRVVGNLPYNISSPLLFHLAEFAGHITEQVFMLQKEVIDRMAATPGSKDYGRLSVMLQARYDIEHLFDVPPEAFDPPPRVMSAIVRMVPLAQQRIRASHQGMFSALVTQAFSQRRKMLRGTLGPLLPAGALEAAGIAPTARAEEVAVETWINLTHSLTHFPAQS